MGWTNKELVDRLRVFSTIEINGETGNNPVRFATVSLINSEITLVYETGIQVKADADIEMVSWYDITVTMKPNGNNVEFLGNVVRVFPAPLYGRAFLWAVELQNRLKGREFETREALRDYAKIWVEELKKG